MTLPRCSSCRRAANPYETQLTMYNESWFCDPLPGVDRTDCLGAAMTQLADV